MTADLSLNLQLLRNIAEMSSNTVQAPLQNSEPAIYAKEGEPNYNEDMDTDKDGIVTMEEYLKYCEENNINTAEEQIQTVQKKVDSILERQQSNIASVNNDFSYNEYIEFCEQNQMTAYKSSSVEIRHEEAGLAIRKIGKALSNYSGSNINFPNINIERMA